jgi:K+-sensing histidine kinase KdpD
MVTYVFLASTLIEMSLMLLALAAFIRQAEEDKIIAQQEKLEAVLQMGRLKDEYSQQLEKDVNQRTRELYSQKQQLEMHNDFRNRFFNYLSHEFRAPLTLSLGPLHDLVNNRYGSIKEKLLPPPCNL